MPGTSASRTGGQRRRATSRTWGRPLRASSVASLPLLALLVLATPAASAAAHGSRDARSANAATGPRLGLRSALAPPPQHATQPVAPPPSVAQPFAPAPRLLDEIRSELDRFESERRVRGSLEPGSSPSSGVVEDGHDDSPRSGHNPSATPAEGDSLSVGLPNAGALVRGVRLPESTAYELVSPQTAYATVETVNAIRHAITHANRGDPATPRLYVGDLSSKQGGPLAPHLSHQSGRDADLGYYYLDPQAKWYTPATPKNLDLERTWRLLRTLIVETEVELIFIDRSLHRPLAEAAVRMGDDRAWVDSLFAGSPSQERAIICHAPGHSTHFHVRLFNPRAQEAAAREYRRLVAEGVVRPAQYFVEHVVKRGETLSQLAQRYDTTVARIQSANQLRGSLIRSGRVYRIPQVGSVRPAPTPPVPPRRTPPEASAGTEASVAPLPGHEASARGPLAHLRRGVQTGSTAPRGGLALIPTPETS